ncbi:MiaB/RimO family radical SAM methylthiotransferase [Nitratidesulfovibrio sp. SRB-5]|uniref:MiaB/RimO family radical SAM methylthiotransferase n=1 Tax=Nitratidesulfovibrio sp. SRB-5 TaxID=2872636 RepID=UPI00102559AD|nr:MiaB/RimO family radical SAM methylthiotransferase [Nitratidesulfovibrio sp. SRB-5]MBZ2172442.1 MiaB/RimO family radical SAM methylthiotransferase [Nitratidesulfovibrio sp. SRB-5]RXF76587.1 MiaB/RimO family radical SAM methylthiotransferase [Desulfovibrio sp. DS-1]
MSGHAFFALTLGCKINQYETEAVREAWLARGWREAADPAAADVLLVNSCAVTARAVADVRQAVARMHRAAPQGRIVVTGCAAQVLREDIAALPGVTDVVGQQAKVSLLRYNPERGAAGAHEPDGGGGGDGGDDLAAGDAVFPAFRIDGFTRSRPVLKVQDGCSHRCTYCIVPLARGAARSRDPREALAEARRLLDAGFRELIVSGVNLRQYGRDLPGGGPDFWDLLAFLERELAPQWAGRARLRISSLEPGQLGERALDVLAESRLVAPQLHLSLQSGSPGVLRRMGRGHYRPEPLLDFVRELAGVWPLFGLGADILTGFPGETDAEFGETLDFVGALPLTYAHVFPYSRRPGTPAAVMEGQLPQEVKKRRAAELRGAVTVKKATFLQRLLDEPRLLVAPEGARGVKGVCEYYAECRFTGGRRPAAQAGQGGEQAGPGDLVAVRPLAVERDGLLVEAV